MSRAEAEREVDRGRTAARETTDPATRIGATEIHSGIRPTAIRAVTFDFYNTLAYPRAGRGRGVVLIEYLRDSGLESDPWEHQVLYDVFEPHAREYSPTHPADVRRRDVLRFAERVFDRLNVRGSDADVAHHAVELWRILGPASLVLYSDVVPVLQELRRRGLPLAVVSNWQCGLAHFCHDLGIGDLLDHVLASAEVGRAKPEPGIFREASRRLGVLPEKTLHVGDSIVDDLTGARAAGLQALLVRRESDSDEMSASIADLWGVLDLLDQAVTDQESGV